MAREKTRRETLPEIVIHRSGGDVGQNLGRGQSKAVLTRGCSMDILFAGSEGSDKRDRRNVGMGLMSRKAIFLVSCSVTVALHTFAIVIAYYRFFCICPTCFVQEDWLSFFLVMVGLF